MNPFRPTFGVTPPLLVGRDEIIEDFVDALATVGAPGRATLVTGLRGTGKTVMINALEDAAKEQGWRVISETANRGFLERIIHEHLPTLLAEIDPDQKQTQVTGGTIAGLEGLQEETSERHQPRLGLRAQMFLAAELIERRGGGGLLFTLDEVHRKQIDDLRALGAEIQHAFREHRAVAFVGAGLPGSVADLVDDDQSTFLRRAERPELRGVDPSDVRKALRVPIETQGLSITEEALETATLGTGGYPFMIQLVGWHAWLASRGASVIEKEHVERGAEKAMRKVGSLVHEPALRDLSAVDRSFLAAMALDDGPSKMGDIATRLGVEAGYAGVYRGRLIDARMIEAAGHGLVDFTLPALREYLRGHAASLSWNHRPGATPSHDGSADPL